MSLWDNDDVLDDLDDEELIEEIRSVQDELRIVQDENRRLKVDIWRTWPPPEEPCCRVIAWREDAGVFEAKFMPSRADEDGVWDEDWDEDSCSWFTDGESLTGDLPTLWQPMPAEPHPSPEQAK